MIVGERSGRLPTKKPPQAVPLRGSISDIAAQLGVNLNGLTCFYYEEYDLQYDTERDCWLPVEPDQNIPTAVELPKKAALEGYDIVTFSMGNSPECSPLS
jgi:hypothetical protein